MDCAAFQYLPQRLLIHPQVVTRRRLNILVPCQLLDKGDVGTVMQKRSAKRVPQQMGGEFLGDAGFAAEPPKQLGHVVARQPPRLLTRGNEERRMGVPAKP